MFAGHVFAIFHARTSRCARRSWEEARGRGWGRARQKKENVGVGIDHSDTVDFIRSNNHTIAQAHDISCVCIVFSCPIVFSSRRIISIAFCQIEFFWFQNLLFCCTNVHHALLIITGYSKVTQTDLLCVWKTPRYNDHKLINYFTMISRHLPVLICK